MKDQTKVKIIGYFALGVAFINIISTIMGLSYAKNKDTKCSSRDRFLMFNLSFGFFLLGITFLLINRSKSLA